MAWIDSPFWEISAPVGGLSHSGRESIATGPAPHPRWTFDQRPETFGSSQVLAKGMPGGTAMSSCPSRSLPRFIFSDAYEKHRKQAPLRRPFRYNPMFAEAVQW